VLGPPGNIPSTAVALAPVTGVRAGLVWRKGVVELFDLSERGRRMGRQEVRTYARVFDGNELLVLLGVRQTEETGGKVLSRGQHPVLRFRAEDGQSVGASEVLQATINHMIWRKRRHPRSARSHTSFSWRHQGHKAVDGQRE
jgi:hypothetical protein